MIVLGRFDCQAFDFIKFKAQAELISVSLDSLKLILLMLLVNYFIENQSLFTFCLTSLNPAPTH